MKRSKPKVGDILFSLNVGNAARDKEQVLNVGRVIKVGRKYFSFLEDRWGNFEHMANSYHIDSWAEKTDYSARTRLYSSEQDFYDEKETSDLITMIRDFFRYGAKRELSLEALREIKNIIEDCGNE